MCKCIRASVLAAFLVILRIIYCRKPLRTSGESVPRETRPCFVKTRTLRGRNRVSIPTISTRDTFEGLREPSRGGCVYVCVRYLHRRIEESITSKRPRSAERFRRERPILPREINFGGAKRWFALFCTVFCFFFLFFLISVSSLSLFFSYATFSELATALAGNYLKDYARNSNV